MDALRQKARNLRNAGTDAERRSWQHLRLKQLDGCRFRRQVPVAGYTVGFLCPEMKLIVEPEGGQHIERAAHGARRTRILEAEGYRVLRYWNEDVPVRTTGVLEDILRPLELAKNNGTSRSKAPLLNPPLRCAQGRRPKATAKDEA